MLSTSDKKIVQSKHFILTRQCIFSLEKKIPGHQSMLLIFRNGSVQAHLTKILKIVDENDFFHFLIVSALCKWTLSSSLSIIQWCSLLFHRSFVPPPFIQSLQFVYKLLIGSTVSIQSYQSEIYCYPRRTAMLGSLSWISPPHLLVRISSNPIFLKIP